MDSTNPYSQNANFVDLLNSQQDGFPPQTFSRESCSQLPIFSTQCTEPSSLGEDTPSERKEINKWSLTEDVVLISAWLNTSNDPVVGNEQKDAAFWKRIADYFAASPKVQGSEKRWFNQCKQR